MNIRYSEELCDRSSCFAPSHNFDLFVTKVETNQAYRLFSVEGNKRGISATFFASQALTPIVVSRLNLPMLW
ncbi:hypothetical protein [Nostoc sp. DedQUE09]|uniref:hypothetical protein n=1 Tax=Nostoc sp. DedQUE09 TaxID=3075394 RepID=UPI002AD53EF3|nr:hypothetical protein [Nostoc sp. DedQUE09]MDZ7954958.1 hypothetical protein [Nostoc sp. DedQUE09]